MSLVYLLGSLILVMGLVLVTLFIKPLRRYSGYISLLAPIIASVYFLSQIPNVMHQNLLHSRFLGCLLLMSISI